MVEASPSGSRRCRSRCLRRPAWSRNLEWRSRAVGVGWRPKVKRAFSTGLRYIGSATQQNIEYSCFCNCAVSLARNKSAIGVIKFYKARRYQQFPAPVQDPPAYVADRARPSGTTACVQSNITTTLSTGRSQAHERQTRAYLQPMSDS